LPPTNKQQFSDEAQEHGLTISVDDAEEMHIFKKEVAEVYLVISSIDTAGFEPASIFMPIPSRRESQ
tara:strand:+ start:583 stop:783 length:201 start_codon:yes stop_codon:yes gene_type:complete